MGAPGRPIGPDRDIGSTAAGQVLRDRVGGMTIELVAGAVVAAGGLGVGVAGEVLHVAQPDAGVKRERRRPSAAGCAA